MKFLNFNRFSITRTLTCIKNKSHFQFFFFYCNFWCEVGHCCLSCLPEWIWNVSKCITMETENKYWLFKLNKILIFILYPRTFHTWRFSYKVTQGKWNSNYCQARLLLFSAQISKFNSQSPNLQKKEWSLWYNLKVAK